MSFLDSFSMFFQDIILVSLQYEEWKYGEKIEDWDIKTDFQWIIQEKWKFWEHSFDNWKNITFTSKDYELRSPVEIKPKKWDRIESNWNVYEVIYPDIVMMDWEIDHNVTIIRLSD